jgi:hypothetical protein
VASGFYAGVDRQTRAQDRALTASGMDRHTPQYSSALDMQRRHTLLVTQPTSFESTCRHHICQQIKRTKRTEKASLTTVCRPTTHSNPTQCTGKEIGLNNSAFGHYGTFVTLLFECEFEIVNNRRFLRNAVNFILAAPLSWISNNVLIILLKVCVDHRRLRSNFNSHTTIRRNSARWNMTTQSLVDVCRRDFDSQ